MKQRIFKFVADAFVGSNLVGRVEATMVASTTSERNWADGKVRFLDGPFANLAGQTVQLVFGEQDVTVTLAQGQAPGIFTAESKGRLPLAWR